VAKREGNDQICNLIQAKIIGAVGCDLVEEGEEGAGEKTQEPRPEGPYGLGRVIGVGHSEPNFLNG